MVVLQDLMVPQKKKKNKHFFLSKLKDLKIVKFNFIFKNTLLVFFLLWHSLGWGLEGGKTMRSPLYLVCSCKMKLIWTTDYGLNYKN